MHFKFSCTFIFFNFFTGLQRSISNFHDTFASTCVFDKPNPLYMFHKRIVANTGE